MSQEIFLDQGQEGECVGFSFAHEEAAKPQVVKDVTEETAHRNYHGAQANDEWPGDDYEGSSVNGGAKYLQLQGVYKNFAWTEDARELATAVSHKGPSVLGIDMHEGMMNPDEDGYLKDVGAVVGGHAILCKGFSVKRNAFLWHNSWGKSWGLRGCAWVKLDTMQRLLDANGEACLPLRSSYTSLIVR